MDTETDPDSLIGEVLASRYRIEARLGRGAMGTVYRARHVSVGRRFAVKVLHPRFITDEKTRRRFAREAELAGSLRHPNVVSVVDAGETPQNLCYLVMEYAEGPSLYQLIAQAAPMPAPRVISLLRQLCDGLQHAHEHGLIHRDFKSENVIVERGQHGNDVPKIVDFGIALLGDSDGDTKQERLTTVGLVLGTPHYMAPEHATGSQIDHRIDLFALGVMSFEMLTGKLPFDGNGVEVARANLFHDTPVMRIRVPNLEVDPLLEALTRRLMMKMRDDRPATARAVRELVDLIDEDREVAATVLGVATCDHEGPVSQTGAMSSSLAIAFGAKPPPIPQPPPVSAASAPWPIAPSSVVVAMSGAHARATPPPMPMPMPMPPPSSIVRGPGSPVPPGGFHPEPVAHDITSLAPVLVMPTDALETESLAELRPRHTALVIGGLATVALVAISIIVMGLRSSEPPATPVVRAPRDGSERAFRHEAQVVADTTAPEAAGSDNIAGDPSSAEPRHAAPVGSAGNEPWARGATGPRIARPNPGRPNNVPVAPSPSAPRVTPPASSPTAPPAAPELAKPAAPPAAASAGKPAAAPPTATSLAQLYAAVGKRLKTLDQTRGSSATADLWPQYLRVRINDVLSDPAKFKPTDMLLRQVDEQITARSQ